MKAPARRLILVAALLAAGCGVQPGRLAGSSGSDALGTRSIQALPPTGFFDQDEIFPHALKLIESARTDICLDMFYMGGKVGEDVARALVAKKQAGLDVKVLYDPGQGYKEPIRKTVRPVMALLKDGGVETLPFPVSKLRGIAPIKADHNKVLIVDGKAAFVGGMNFADVNAPNHDLMVQVGGPSAAYMKAVFKLNWALAASKAKKYEVADAETDLAGEEAYESEVLGVPPQPPGAPGGTPVEEDAVSVTHSGLYGFPTRPQVASLIDNARKRIWLQMFVLADDDMCERLKKAAERGVEVKVLTDPNKFAFAINLGGMPNLGAVKKFRGTPVQIQFFNTKSDEQMHIKMCLFDDDQVAVGSTNWTKAGFDSNSETTLIARSTRLHRQLGKIFTRDWLAATAANPPSQLSPGWKGTVADFISFLF
ncbi:MAG: phosphatidylserine/phosphatidylglycerophosphate/cardiolipin synthase family protein [Candidatus Sericytochromatia bacterium]|nr:phosphatidylserine/phosphatidylglycerophosphate/cardiolipin synthase family protein [Candidatus Tanganyikabacteria bacterium]